ncbi:MAG TPA: phospholipase D-like domain-containing protein [Brevundimonas sp.]|jgi:phosphatidylserine/phosphatidylglycerophosphate/cardiolipin synthase-like enzyme|uniref:phospholipase D-like domain-containing protein n=1 Tax=Brevundimonas sp. TaxID=1871086 RepID=UPI002E0DDA46|nr:phospholipase D-like domain-containing protein [Brevundimonas sp.]
MEAGPGTPSSLLDPGRNCWRVAPAHRFAVLLDTAAYFDALDEALAAARRSVIVLGWQFDPRTRLDPSAEGRDAEIGRRLRRMVRQNPDLDVRLLIWRSPILIAASQGFYPHRAQAWFRKRLVELHLDSPGPIGACHHQKLVLIDEAVAFVGGGDIATDRWDTPEHLDGDPRRVMPGGRIAPPRHETMCVLDGPAARALADLARDRWYRATWERTAPVEVRSDPWPASVTPDLIDVPVGIARTEPGWRGRPEVRENEALHLSVIAAARRLIYFENQYFTSTVIAEALAARLAEPDGPEIVLVTTGRAPSWFDSMTMDPARAEMLYRLEQADRYHRLFAFSPLTEARERLIVHAKVTIVDDALLRIGSTNLNNRSMGFDTECDVAVEPRDEAGREVVRAFRHRTIAHFLGQSAEAFAAVEALEGSTGRAIEKLADGRMRLLGEDRPTPLEQMVAEWQLGDPHSPRDSFRPWRRRLPSQRPRVPRS